jgi:hypothetical protein
LATLVAITLTGMRMRIQAELDTFFCHLIQQVQLIHEVCKQALAQTQAKLSLTAHADADLPDNKCIHHAYAHTALKPLLRQRDR